MGNASMIPEPVQEPLSAEGDAASDSPVAGAPIAVGGRASTALPTDVSADGDAVFAWFNRKGAAIVSRAPHIGLVSDPWFLNAVTARYTTTQTSTVLKAAAAGEKLVVTRLQIGVGGTTAGEVQVYFGTAAYVRGTNRALFDHEFAPSTTLKPGVIIPGPFIAAVNGDDLMVTTSAALNPLTITAWFYIVS